AATSTGGVSALATNEPEKPSTGARTAAAIAVFLSRRMFHPFVRFVRGPLWASGRPAAQPGRTRDRRRDGLGPLPEGFARQPWCQTTRPASLITTLRARARE